MRTACFLGRGRRPDAPYFCPAFLKAGEMFPKGNGFILFASTKRTKSSRRAAALSTPGDGSKLYRLYFFVILPALVSKPACGATRFFGCFEPVQKGYCSADARLCFSKMGCYTASSQGRMYTKRAVARYLCCCGNLFLRYAD